MVERHNSFGGDNDDTETDHSKPRMVGYRHRSAHEIEEARTQSPSSAVSGRFDDPVEIFGAGDPVVQLPTDGGAPDLSVCGLTEDNPSSLPDVPTMRMWSDEVVERWASNLLACTNEEDLNILDLRRRWVKIPVPDTRQLNRVMYRMRDRGQVEQLPPNGKNQKPCWRKIA